MPRFTGKFSFVAVPMGAPGPYRAGKVHVRLPRRRSHRRGAKLFEDQGGDRVRDALKALARALRAPLDVLVGGV